MGSMAICTHYGGILLDVVDWVYVGVVGLWASMVPSSTVSLFHIRWFLQGSLGFLFLEHLAPPDKFG